MNINLVSDKNLDLEASRELDFHEASAERFTVCH